MNPQNCIELSLESSDDEGDLAMSGQARSPRSSHLQPGGASISAPAVICVELSLDSSDEETNNFTYGRRSSDNVVDGGTLSNHTVKRVLTQSPAPSPATATAPKKKTKMDDSHPVVRLCTFTNIAAALPHLRTNLSSLPQMEAAVMKAAKESCRLQSNCNDIDAMVKVCVITLACNMLHGNGQLMKKMARFHAEPWRMALNTFVSLMETHLTTLHAVNRTHKDDRSMITAFLASIPHLGRDHAFMLNTLGFTVEYLEAIVATSTTLPRLFTERDTCALLEWLDFASIPIIEAILMRSVSAGRLSSFLVFFSSLLASIPHDVVFAKCGSVVLSLLKMMFSSAVEYGAAADKMESVTGHKLALCIQGGLPNLEFAQLTADYLQQGLSNAVAFQTRVVLIFYVLFALKIRKELLLPSAEHDGLTKFHAAIGVGYFDTHLSMHVIHGITECHMMGFEARQDEVMEVACAFALHDLAGSGRLIEQFAVSMPECIWQQLLVFPSLLSTTIPSAYDQCSFRFRQCQSLSEVLSSSDPVTRQQYMGHALHLSQLFQFLLCIVTVYSKKNQTGCSQT